jgi:DNA-binding beta-propeller fold protein YncE
MYFKQWIAVLCVAAVGSVASVRADKLVLVAGGGDGSDGPAKQAKIQSPFAVDTDGAGNLYFCEMTGNRIGRIDSRGMLALIAGTGQKGNDGDGGPSAKAQLNGPHNLAVAPDGKSLFVADTWNNRIRRIDLKTGIINAFAGTGAREFDGDGGPARDAKFGGIYCLAIDPRREKMYVADLDNRRIRAIDLRTSIVTTVAGNGKKGIPADGAEAAQSPLLDPRAVAVDGKGNVYILERSGNALRVVDAKGRIRTVVGTGKPGATGDDGDAKQATLNGPKHLCIDRDGNVLIADTENHLIRKYFPAAEKIVRIAGAGKKGNAGLGGPPLQAELAQPHGVYVHPNGDIYIADSSNDRILRIQKE